MRHLRHPIAVLVIACCALVACGGDDAPSADAGGISSVAQVSSDGSGSDAGADATQPAGGGAVDCAAVKEALAKIIINWQVVIGLSNTASSEWAGIPLGSIASFGEQLATVTTALGSDADAAEALSFMSGANDIVQRGIGGDAAAQDDLATYMGTDTGVNLAKQLAISVAYQNAGCK